MTKDMHAATGRTDSVSTSINCPDAIEATEFSSTGRGHAHVGSLPVQLLGCFERRWMPRDSPPMGRGSGPSQYLPAPRRVHFLFQRVVALPQGTFRFGDFLLSATPAG